MMTTARFHVALGHKRTTISLDHTLVELLALKMGHVPGSRSAQQAIRRWLQQRLDEANDPNRCRVSQWLQAEIIHALVDNKLSDAYTDWLLNR